MKNLRFERYVIVFLIMIMVIGFTKSVDAEILKVGEGDTAFTQGNRLVLQKEADIKGFTITSNIPKDRISIFNKKPTDGIYEHAGIRFARDGNYKNKQYKSYQQNYGSKAVEIKNLRKSDKIEVDFKNVGTYDGQPIDLKMSMSDMDYALRPGNADNGISLLDFSENPFSGYFFAHIEHGVVEFTFYDSKSGKKINTSDNSFLTFNSLNGYDTKGTQEFVNYLNYDTSKKGSEVNAYLTTDTDLDFIVVPNIGYKKAVYAGIADDFTDYLGGATYTKNSVSFQLKGETHKFVFGTGMRSAWAAVSTGVLFNVTADDPIKTVENNSGQNIDGKNVQVGQEVIYKINQKVHILGQDILDKYSQWSMKDSLPSNVDFVKADVIDEKGKVISDAGTIKYDSQKHVVTFEASKKFLSETIAYSGETYSLKITTKVSSLKANNDAKEFKLENEALSSINKVEKKTNKVSNTVKVFNVNVKHIFEKDSELLKEINEKKYDGEKYSYQPLKDLKYKDLFFFIPITDQQSGTINGKNVELKFFYKAPLLLEIGLSKIQIYTADAKKGLPINVFFNNKLVEAKKLDELKGRELTLTISNKQTGEKVIQEKFDVSKLPEEYNGVIPSEVLVDDYKETYKAHIAISKVGDEDILVTDPEIETDGYTAAKRQIIIQPGKELEYEGVIMTEREIKKDMKLLYENIKANNDRLSRQKTGYGFEINTEITYINELKEETEILLEANLQDELIDSYLDYEGVDTKVTIPLENLKNEPSEDNITHQYAFSLPRTLVEKSTGNLFTQNQFRANDERISFELIDGGRKLYVPIWSDLKTHNMSVKTGQPIGINLINVNMEKELEVYAYMFATIGSDTLAEDEILIEPFNFNNPFPEGLPDGWKEQDIKWLNE